MALFRRGCVWWTRLRLGAETLCESTGQTHKGLALAHEARRRNEFRAKREIERLSSSVKGRRPAMPLGEAADRYVDTVLMVKRRTTDSGPPRWAKNEVYRVDRVVRHFGRSAPLTRVVKWSQVAAFNESLLGEMTPPSANRLLSILRAILFKAYEWGELSQPPYVRQNRGHRLHNRYLTRDEEERLVAACDSMLRDFVIFILDTGARKAEALSLRWRDVDLDRRPRAVVHFTKTKNGEIRTVPLPQRAATVLLSLKENAGDQNTLEFSHPARKTLYTRLSKVFARRGDRIPLSNYDQLWRRARRKVGLDDVRLHDLRHTYASKLVRRGVPILAVARLLGHRQIEMTMRYAHLAVEGLDDAVAALD